MLIIDVLRSSHLRTPAHLSAEILTNLGENQVPHNIFITLLQRGLQELIDGLITWEGKDAMKNLWCSVSRAGGVLSARLAREASGEARVQGHFVPDSDTDDDEDALQLDDAVMQRSSAWWADQISGCPSSLEETVMVLLDSGFTPLNCAVLRDKLKQVVMRTIRTYVLRYRIEVPMSCSAFVVPGELLFNAQESLA